MLPVSVCFEFFSISLLYEYFKLASPQNMFEMFAQSYQISVARISPSHPPQKINTDM